MKTTLTRKERRAEKTFMRGLDVPKRRTKRPVILAMIGLVGSGKSSVARYAAARIGAVVIAGDNIRVELRKQGERYENARRIAEDAALRVIESSGSVVLDSDFSDAKKRARIKRLAKAHRIRLVYVRTHCDFDVMVGRTIAATYRSHASDFFGGATSKWRGTGQTKGAAVKLREMWRRTPRHYRWVNQTGGQWVLKKLPVRVIEIDTTDARRWKGAVDRVLLKLRR
ncbi:MAG: AAA family ATPase [Candidatus Sungbacteria bacterium]|uniref:AAA family ATPase n=1 Tax=Candidatus Sungiibacteriota bacterium TaxID=2750080 RepID=A0A9D6QUE8_9BACT|nr:AAA family ATPase [Candidatus Sungbacteria bacterium]